MTKSKRPRVTELERSENSFDGQYKQHDIHIERDDDCRNWYITVRGPDGCHTYDGWWRDSGSKSLDEAIIEACHGSMIWQGGENG